MMMMMMMMKNRSEEMQTLRAGCSKAEPKIFRQAANPLQKSTKNWTVHGQLRHRTFQRHYNTRSWFACDIIIIIIINAKIKVTLSQ